jgi:hypothetical protein
MSDKPIVLENTKGPQNLRVNHMNPFEAINFARQRSASDDNNKSSSFVYFENMQNEEQTYNFVTIESLFRQEPSKFYRQSSTIASDFFQRTDDVIISYSVPTQFSSIDKLVYGGPRKISQFNFTTLEYNSNIINTSDSVFATGGSGQSDTSSNFKQQYDQDSIPPQSMIAVDISQRSSTFIPESTPDLQAYLAILLQNSMKIKVPGDTALTVGIMINADIPNKNGTTGPTDNDPLMSGKFLVTRIHHKIGHVQDKPRYTCIMECIKGAYNEGV